MPSGLLNALKFKGLFYSALPEQVRNLFLQYRVDFNEAIEFTDEELREMYSRLNKYSVALTKQELRRADFPGDFLMLAEQLALHEYLEVEKLFTVANRRRLADVEFVSELVAALLAGPQDKRDSLDSFYLTYSVWDKKEQTDIETRFLAVIADLDKLFPVEMSLSSTRFRQKSDFYSLMLAIDDLRRAGGRLDGIELQPIQADLRILDDLIAPESFSPDCRDYAIKCVSQANSHASRRWRMEFLKAIMAGTYLKKPPSGDGSKLFYRLATTRDIDLYCPRNGKICGDCGEEIDEQTDNYEEFVIGWPKDSPTFQVDNLSWLHKECIDQSKWHVITDEDADGQLTFSVDKQLGLI